MSVPYIPEKSSRRFYVPRTLADDFDRFLNMDIPNTVMDFELIKNWYDRSKDDYEPHYIRGEIYPDSTKSRYENTDNALNLRCSVKSGIRQGDIVIEPDGSIYVLDWAVHLQSNNAPTRALRCNMMFEVKRHRESFTDDEGFVVDDLGYAVSGEKYDTFTDPQTEIVAPSIPANAFRYDGRPEYVSVSGTPGTIAGALTIVTVQFNETTQKVRIGDKFDWGGNTHEIVDIDGVDVDITQTYGVLRFQAKRAAGGLNGYD